VDSLAKPSCRSTCLAGRWPEVASRLHARGIDPDPEPGESSDGHDNRIGTALMALFRDTRDSGAFEALHALTGPGVLQWIRSLTGRELLNVDPAEVLQDTFVNVYRYPGAFREDHRGSFRVWVRTIAGNVVRRAALSRARHAEHELPEPGDLEDRASGPAQAFVDEDEAQRLRRAWLLLLWYYGQAWKELGQRDRRTLHLVEVEGLSYQEAGAILSVGRSNMKMIVFRSRRRIARRMRDAMSAGSAMSPGTSRRVAPELVA
jgi:RNA polymerase sigma factor (sigma-70 family)